MDLHQSSRPADIRREAIRLFEPYGQTLLQTGNVTQARPYAILVIEQRVLHLANPQLRLGVLALSSEIARSSSGSSQKTPRSLSSLQR
jgi:hypothetical protein